MIGAVVGDVLGSVYEQMTAKRTDIPLFHYLSRPTDDSVMTLAIAAAIVRTNGEEPDYAGWMRRLGRAYPHAGYGGHFKRWIDDAHAGPYGSWGNGSAMRVSAAGWAYKSVERVLEEAAASAAVTHDHPEGIKGAQAVALGVFLARSGETKQAIRKEISDRFDYDLSRSLNSIRPEYSFEISCQKSVPEAIIAFLESDDYEGAVRNAISLGGDADTQAAIAGAIAEAFYGGVPAVLASFVLPRLTDELLSIVAEVCTHISSPSAKLVEAELSARATAAAFDRRHPYTVLLSQESWSRVEAYTGELRSGAYPGARMKEQMKRLPVIDPGPEWILHSLLNSKKPRIFAESEVVGDGSDWTQEELRLLGDVAVAIPASVFDNGLHRGPSVHSQPMETTLLFVPGALLRADRGRTPADNEVVADGRIDMDRYVALYERRLLPSLVWASADATRRGQKALITVPGLGCGQFAGPFRGSLGVRLAEALRRILARHVDRLAGIRAVWYDPYSEGQPGRERIGSLDFLVRPLLQSSQGIPQLCHPASYEEQGDSFGDCRLYSVVAWDHVSWPGNDFIGGSRATDDGVKAAATDMLFRLTGVRGQYNMTTNTYDPPDGIGTWEELISRYGVELRATAGLVIVSGEAAV
jgi:ADP-ribosylglycohydrolase